jgi:hypothetical protein
MRKLRPGQPTLNELESAILSQLAKKCPALIDLIPSLHVLSREYTGVGSYTRFQSEPKQKIPGQQIGLDTLIVLPGVPSGLGAVLHCENGSPILLEIFTYGDEHWDGVPDGFSIKKDND